MIRMLCVGLVMLSGCAVVQKVESAIDCGGICERYKSCFDSDYDTGACAASCRRKASEDADYRRKADMCMACIKERSCTKATFACAADPAQSTAKAKGRADRRIIDQRRSTLSSNVRGAASRFAIVSAGSASVAERFRFALASMPGSASTRSARTSICAHSARSRLPLGMRSSARCPKTPPTGRSSCAAVRWWVASSSARQAAPNTSPASC